MPLRQMWPTPYTVTKTVARWSREETVSFYLALMKLHLENCVQFRTPHYKDDIDVQQQAQQRAIKMIRGWNM